MQCWIKQHIVLFLVDVCCIVITHYRCSDRAFKSHKSSFTAVDCSAFFVKTIVGRLSFKEIKGLGLECAYPKVQKGHFYSARISIISEKELCNDHHHNKKLGSRKRLAKLLHFADNSPFVSVIADGEFLW